MVEIIPKPAEKIPLWQNLLLLFSMIVLITAVCGYFLLGHFQEKTRQEIKITEEKLAKAETKERKELESQILEYQKKIDNFTFLFNRHKASSSSFEFLEGIIHPKIWLSDLRIDTREATCSFSGEAENFVVLGQQLIIFRETNEIIKTDLPEIFLREGKIYFTFNFSESKDSSL